MIVAFTSIFLIWLGKKKNRRLDKSDILARELKADRNDWD
jgi:hypothetical protein